MEIPPDHLKPRSIAGRGIQPRFGQLAQDCRKLVMNRLAEHLTGVFAQVDDTLFNCAEKAENNQVQTLFFDSMRDIRKQRALIERTYHQQIAAQITHFLEGRHKATAAEDGETKTLSLVQNEEYEESLLVTTMVTGVKTRCPQALFALEQRLTYLSDGQPLAEADNPFGPQVIAQAFRDALAPCPFVLQIKTILYMLFEQHVMQGLEPLYDALNGRLIEAGVLPNLKFSAQRSPARAPVTATTEPEHTVPRAPHTETPTGQPLLDLNAPPPSDPATLLMGLSELLDQQRLRAPHALLPGTARSIASFAPEGAVTTYSAGDLLDALDRLQQQSAEDLEQRLRQPQEVEPLKINLQQQLETHSRLPGQQKLSQREANMVDLVGMLFDFILDDENLPDACKTILSHLHTSYLKIALRDKALFTQHQHPARRLLNSLAQAGVLYGEEGEDGGLLSKMRWVVEQVIRNYQGDLSLFERLLTDFNQFTASLQHKVELRERRAVEAAKGRDRLLDARQQAEAVIAQALEKREPPALLRSFLEQTWADVLVFVLLRHEQSSPEWRHAAEVAQLLAWSCTPLDEPNQQKLQSLRLGLLEDVRLGLELLGGYHEDGIRRRLQDIVACQHAAQSREPVRIEPSRSAAIDPPAGRLASMLGEDAALLQKAPTADLSPQTRALMKTLARIEFGTWFEFTQDGQPRLLKLSWFSPTTRNYMFVDQSGQRVAIKPVSLLASEMEQGVARIMPTERTSPLVDRALGAIYRVLQRISGRTTDPS